MNHVKLGLLALENGDHQEAVNIFRRALDTQKSAAAFAGLGRAYELLGDPGAARWAYYKGLELDGANPEIAGRLASLEKPAVPGAPGRREPRFRTGADYVQVFDGEWRRLFIKGVNMGLGLPGFFPGEYPIRQGTYLKWFQQISALGANAVRLYTVHPPDFYEALAQFNAAGERLYLLQGIWCELPERNDFSAPAYLASVKESVAQAVDVVYGAARLPERAGYAHGDYRHDVSFYTAGFIFGREWEACAVKAFNAAKGKADTEYAGKFLTVRGATPFEAWIMGICDYLQGYEHDHYGLTRPVSAVNWPTLDPLPHPSESNHEDELKFQGIATRTGVCNENEDMETVDVAKISSRQGGGYFATYHVYPYYPDFMNYDYVDEGNPYSAYLRALKAHHGGQPVFVAEFGVPSSREITHWQKNGWHHGGHSEKRQGEIAGTLMKSIHEAGMAGGILFSWADEWFKRNWLFLPFELPAERTPLWFNFQDAEQNYGLLAAYPGYPDRAVSLAGKGEEWQDAFTLYRKGADRMAFGFGDGHDGVRALVSLQARHDEGFLYLRLETGGTIDFAHAHYLIGLDTCTPDTGERLLPFRTNVASPVGLKFLIHLAGKDTSRILVCKAYDKYLNAEKGAIRPEEADQGEWVVMQNRTNARRISKDQKRFYPSRVFSMSGLRFGTLDRSAPAYDSLADFYCRGNAIEIRLPWGLINFTDPSSRTVLWLDGAGKTRKSEGIGMVAASYKPARGALLAQQTGRRENMTDSLPQRLVADNIRSYVWEGWGTPIYHTYLKESYARYRDVLASLPGVF